MKDLSYSSNHICESKFCLNQIDFNILYPEKISYLAQFFLQNTYQGDADITISSKIDFVDKLEIPENAIKISNSILKASNSILYWFNDNLQIKLIHVSCKEITSHIRLYYKKGYKTRIKALLRRSNLNEDYLPFIYVQALRHAILYPYFVLMNANFGVTLSHGSAFCKNNKGFGILGFDGVGKSSIVSEVLQMSADVISDNFVLYDQNKIYFVPDPLRIYDKDTSHLFGKTFKKLDTKLEKISNTALIYTYLGNEYWIKKKDIALLNQINRSFFNFLPEFYDLNRYITVIKLFNPDLNYVDLLNSQQVKLYECQRANIEDNRRLINEILLF